METLEITIDHDVLTGCDCALIVPEIAVAEPGYIKGLSARGGGNEKHEFHALAQTAYYQFQDAELEIDTMRMPAVISLAGSVTELPAGLLVYRDGGAIRAAVHEGLSAKKLLEAAHRFCTRWVRLDI